MLGPLRDLVFRVQRQRYAYKKKRAVRRGDASGETGAGWWFMVSKEEGKNESNSPEENPRKNGVFESVMTIIQVWELPGNKFNQGDYFWHGEGGIYCNDETWIWENISFLKIVKKKCITGKRESQLIKIWPEFYLIKFKSTEK